MSQGRGFLGQRNLETIPRTGACLLGLMLSGSGLHPVHDQPETLAEYGRTWNIDPKGWHLLTGPPAEVQKFCERFGVAFFPDEGQLIHSLHTLIIDRHGKMAVNLEGNEFTPQELGDLVQSMLNGSTSSKAH